MYNVILLLFPSGGLGVGWGLVDDETAIETKTS